MTLKTTSATVEFLERFLENLGYPGRYQTLIYVLLTFNFILLCFTEFSYLFFNEVPLHRCKLDSRHQPLAQYDDSYPIETRDGVKVFSSCVMWADPDNRTSGLRKCLYGWEYRLVGDQWTVASEWDLVCENRYLLDLIPTVQIAFALLGSVIFSVIADKFGRRPVLLISSFLVSLISGSFYLIYNFTAYMILRGAQGFFGAGLFIASYVMCMEILPAQYRPHGAIGIQVIWSFSFICLVITNLFIKHWRYVQLSLTVPFIVTIMYIWLIPESLRWLITESRVEESKCAAQRILRYNKIAGQENLTADIRKINKLHTDRCRSLNIDTSRYNHAFWDLFRTAEMRKRTLILFTIWFSSSMAYSFLGLTVIPLTQSKYADAIISSVVEAGSIIIFLFIVNKFGSRVPLCSCFVTIGLLGITSAVLPRILPNSLLVSQTIAFLSLLGKTFSAITLAISQLYTTELLPTTLRTTGFGLCFMWLKIGNLLGPQLYILSEVTIPAVPFVSIGALSLFCCVLTAFLPCTRLNPLPATVEDIDIPKQKPASRQVSGIYTIEGSYSSRAHDIIRKEAVIKTISTNTVNSSNLSTAQNINTVRFTDDVMEISSNSSGSYANDRAGRSDAGAEDSDDGGFTTFGKTNMRKTRLNETDPMGRDMSTFVKTNPLIISDLDSDEDNSIVNSNVLQYPQYPSSSYLRSRNFVDLDTAVL